MKIRNKVLVFAASLMLMPLGASAQYVSDATGNASESDATVLTLEDALKIALSENVSVKVADQEITRSEYAKKGTYAALFPQVNASGSFQRTIKKQVMYMDMDNMPSAGDETQTEGSEEGSGEESAAGGFGGMNFSDGMKVGRWNTFNGGVSASLNLVNPQLWKSVEISGTAIELAVEKARSSRLDMITEVKQGFYAVLLAKEAFNVYKSVYENAVDNFGQTERRYNVQKASELEYIRAKANVASAIPNVVSSESQIILALWQLKALMGVDLDMNIDVAGALADYTAEMMREINEGSEDDLSGNTTLRQLAIQAEQLAQTVQMQKYAYIPTLSANFSYSMNAMTNDFKFSQFKWSPYSYVGLSLNIPIFSGMKRYNDVRQAKVQQSELGLQRLDTERQLKIAIRQYVTTMETNMKSYYSALDAVELAQKSYDISAKSYNVGKSTLTDLNDAQLVLTQSELSKSQAVYNYLVAKSNLEKTIGRDFLDEEGKVSFNK